MSTKEKTTLKALEKDVQKTGYRVIYEKGTFQSGHCIVKEKKVIVINKFMTDKQKILTLKEIAQSISIEDHSSEDVSTEIENTEVTHE